MNGTYSMKAQAYSYTEHTASDVPADGLRRLSDEPLVDQQSLLTSSVVTLTTESVVTETIYPGMWQINVYDVRVQQEHSNASTPTNITGIMKHAENFNETCLFNTSMNGKFINGSMQCPFLKRKEEKVFMEFNARQATNPTEGLVESEPTTTIVADDSDPLGPKHKHCNATAPGPLRDDITVTCSYKDSDFDNLPGWSPSDYLAAGNIEGDEVYYINGGVQ